MNYMDKTYNRGGIWCPGSWGVIDEGDGQLYVTLHGRAKDVNFHISKSALDEKLAGLERQAFPSDSDMIWFALNSLKN